MVNIISGGLHARRGMDVQDFLIVPVGAITMLEAIHLAARIRDATAAVCADRGLDVAIAIAIDVAATRDDMIDLVTSWVDEFPILSIEDPLDEEDWAGWNGLTSRIGGRVHLIGDDLFTTNAERLRKGIASGCATGILVKVNQNGTLTGTLQVAALAGGGLRPGRVRAIGRN